MSEEVGDTIKNRVCVDLNKGQELNVTHHGYRGESSLKDSIFTDSNQGLTC